MDECDLGNKHADMYLGQTINQIRNRPMSATSAKECIDCGEPIPETRREASPGCCRCIACATEFERNGRHGA